LPIAKADFSVHLYCVYGDLWTWSQDMASRSGRDGCLLTLWVN